MNAACRRHQTAFLIWMGVYCAVLLLDVRLLPDPARPDAAHIVGALVPLVPLIFAGIANVRGIRASDELQRRIFTEGMIFSVFGTIAASLTVGFLQMLAGLPLFSIFWVFPVMMLLYGLGVFIGRRRYA